MLDYSFVTIVSVVTISLLASQIESFTVHPSATRPCTSNDYLEPCEFAAAAVREFCNGRKHLRYPSSSSIIRLDLSKGPGNIQRPENEFSRTYQTDRILGGGPRQRDYEFSINAKEEECGKLAERFDLANIAKLGADLSLRREGGQNSRGGSRVFGVEVEGTVRATVTQTCVRSNEKFDVDLEFPIFAVVRPISSEASEDDDDLGIDAASLEAAAGMGGGNRRKRGKEVKSARTTGNISDMDVMELQRLLQDFDVEDDVIEDEAIYSSTNNMLDAGELVSQLFWLQLDPYPKRPGTGPVFSSIKG
mmetsp:Transcript_2537/g.3703  ORF Transcript_2537/g.3703 Transcript_2537/m.3703 type:complete len:305 (-) Transcript_2537:81-995(-)